ncbi:MAG: hypothetical protein ACVCEJ_00540 [Candidatus Izemoplasmataceae bacterium]
MNNHKMIFIEGLPGSGKTTFSKKLHQYLTSKNEKAIYYTEGMHNPLSLAWQGLFSDEEFHFLLETFPDLSENIKANTIKQIGKNVVAYIKVSVSEEQKSFYDYVKKYEIYDASKSDFINTYQLLYHEFRRTHQVLNESHIFECILLQNHVNQFLAGYNLNEKDIFNHIKSLIDNFSSFNILIIYIKQTNIKNTLNKIARERLSPNKNMFPDWIDTVIDYITSTPYGKLHNLKGKDGLIEYSTRHQEIELAILSKLKIPHLVVELDEDYDKVFEQIKEVVIE